MKTIIPLLLLCLAASPATSPAPDAADSVAAHKANMDAAYTVLVQTGKQFEAAKAAAKAAFDASAEGKRLIAEVARKRASVRAGADPSTDTAAAALEAAERQLEAARYVSVGKDVTVMDVLAKVQAANKVWKQARADLRAAEEKATGEKDAADPAAKLRREIAEAIKAGDFIKGMTEADADAAAKALDDPKAPMRRLAQDQPDGTRVIKYWGYRTGDPEFMRYVKVILKDGVALKVDDVRRLPPQ